MIADFSRKRKGGFGRNKLLFQVLGILFFLIIAALIFADVKIYQRKRELISQVNSYKKQIEDIKKSSQKLKEEIANSDNKDYLEKIAYEQLGQQKPGEQEVIFVAQDTKPKSTEESSENFWTGWLTNAWNWIKSKF